jgi:hypothetical protein
MFYLLACRECGDPDRPLPMPFGSPAERGKWASEHTRATGHERWIVLDQPEGGTQSLQPAGIGEDGGVVPANTLLT